MFITYELSITYEWSICKGYLWCHGHIFKMAPGDHFSLKSQVCILRPAIKLENYTASHFKFWDWSDFTLLLGIFIYLRYLPCPVPRVGLQILGTFFTRVSECHTVHYSTSFLTKVGMKCPSFSTRQLWVTTLGVVARLFGRAVVLLFLFWPFFRVFLYIFLCVVVCSQNIGYCFLAVRPWY